MWSIRVLSGSQAGQIVPLKMGRNLIGRNPQCEVRVTDGGVSKEHAEIHVYKDKILVIDLKSSNGTFVNGVKVQNSAFRLGDKLSVHDVMLDIVPTAEPKKAAAPRPAPRPRASVQQARPHAPVGHVSPMPQMPPMSAQPSMSSDADLGQAASVNAMTTEGFFHGIMANITDWLEKAALPAVYKLAEVFEVKLVLLLFIGFYIFTVTTLATLPMVRISRSSILKESERRVSSLARALAQTNQKALLSGSISQLGTNSIETEDGVKEVYIVQQADGMILVPASRAGTIPDRPFIHQARRELKSTVGQVDSDTIGASFPIGIYDPVTGDPVVKAHAVVIYNIGSISFDEGQVISLFMQVLVIASLVGLVLFYFMYRLIEYPIQAVNSQLDLAMREKSDNIRISIIFPALSALISNINSLLTRHFHGDDVSGGGGGSSGRDSEAVNLASLIGYPCLMVGAGGNLMASNTGFDQLTGLSVSAVVGQPVTSIPDNALVQNLVHLVGKAKEVPQVVQKDEIEFSGHPCHLNCQAIMGETGPEYYIITVVPKEGE